jgi:hypothetical protein
MTLSENCSTPKTLTIRSNDEGIRLNGIGKGQGIYVTTGPELP